MNKLIKPYLKLTSDSWKVDETYVKIKGIWHYLYRAIDKQGNTLDWMLSRNRNKQSAKRFFKKLLVLRIQLTLGSLMLIKAQHFHLH
jgi:transposase-like protein